jgi:hypothetical protein
MAEEPGGRSVEVDRAVEKALKFLHDNQRSDGSWKLQQLDNNTAVTSLAVMAFLSAGYVPGEGKYGETVQKGVEWVLKRQLPNGLLATDNAQYEMYQHGICTLMLAEVVGMTEGKLTDEVREKLGKAVEVILQAQCKNDTHKGGWRYTHTSRDADMSVTGWQIMALRAAKNVGCDVPPESIDNAIDYIKRCRESHGGFRYMVNSHVTIPCTCTAILALELCGKEQHRSPEVLDAAAYLLRSPPRWGQAHQFYAFYYCAQATFQLGGNYWNHFRPLLQKDLLDNQRPNGSWDSEFGPFYSTAMAVLALTVEDRLLPIYQRSEDATEK